MQTRPIVLTGTPDLAPPAVDSPVAVEAVYWPHLDGLRTLAVGLVLLTHAWQYPVGNPQLNRLAAAGWMGVDLFFVLSGFLITGILRRTRHDPQYFMNFYARRALRIVPAYLALVAAVLIALPWVTASTELTQVQHQRWWYLFYLSNFALAAGGWQLFVLDITWSLAVEEQFYLVWPTVVRWIDRLAPLCIGLALGLPLLRLVLWQAGVSWMWIHMMMPLRADAFALGALLALRRPSLARMKQLLVGSGTVILLLIMLGRFDRHSMLVNTVGYTLSGLASVALVALARERHRWTAWLNWRPVVHVGRVSYGVYLFHPLCLLALGLVMPAPAGLGGSALWVALVSLLAVAAASLSFYGYERPFLRLKRRFE